MNHFHAAGGIAFLVHTLLRRRAAARRRAHRRRPRAVALHAPSRVLRGDELTLGGGPEGVASTSTCCARPTTRSRPTAACRCWPARWAAPSSRPPRSSPSTGSSPPRRVVFDDQDDFLAAFGAGELDGRDFVAVIRYQGPAANGMPELHKLTPALGVLQDRGQRVAIVTDGRMSGASGKVPAAIHVTPEAALGGPLARVRDGDLITVDATAGLLDLHVDRAELARPPGDRPRAAGRRVGRHRPRAVRRVPGHRRLGRHRRQRLPRASPSRRRRSPLSSTPDSLLDSVPVVPVVVVDDLAQAVPVARALVAGGLPVIELTLRTPVALDAIRAIADEVPEILVGAGTVVTPGQAKEAARRRARSSWSPPGPRRRCWTRWPTPACRSCPARPPSPRCWPCSRPGFTEMKFFPAEAVGRRGVPDVDRLAGARPPGSARPAGSPPPTRAVVPRAAERRLRRRLLAHPGRRRAPRRLGRRISAGSPRRPPRLQLAARGGSRPGAGRRPRSPPSGRTSWSGRRTRSRASSAPCDSAIDSGRWSTISAVPAPAAGSGRKRPARTPRARSSSRSATVARALVIAASIFSRLRTMRASAISRRDVVLVVRRDRVGVEPGEDLAERRALVEDRRPGQPGLERLQGQPLEVRRLAVDRHAPLGVVVVAHHPGPPRPRAAGDAVLTDHRSHAGHPDRSPPTPAGKHRLPFGLSLGFLQSRSVTSFSSRHLSEPSRGSQPDRAHRPSPPRAVLKWRLLDPTVRGGLCTRTALRGTAVQTDPGGNP